MYEIVDQTQPPYASICYIQCEWADGTLTRASGVVVGLNDVLTAHHVVYDPTHGGYATSITITPAADIPGHTWDLIAPFGRYTDVQVIYARTAQWDSDGDDLLYDEESQFDLALLGLASPIGNVTGWLPVSTAASDFSGLLTGYPASGTGLMGLAAYADASSQYSVFDVQSNLGPGASGGPLLRTDGTGTSVAGVLSSGAADLSESTYAAVYGAGNWDWLQYALRGDNSVLPAALRAGEPPPVVPADAGSVIYPGSQGDDIFSGTAASETMRGGQGRDTSNFSGARADYLMAHSAQSITVADTVLGRDGSDSLSGMERAVFSDMTVNLEIGAAALGIAAPALKLLEELYIAFFNRVPEADGLAYWMGELRSGRSLDAIADAFYDAALLYPAQTGYSASMTATDFVNLVYRNVLGRADGADAEGLAYWSNALITGGESRGSLVSTILYSAHTFKGHSIWGWVADLLDNKAAVAQRFAVEQGLNYNTPEESIAHGMQIAAAVTPWDVQAAIALIGVNDGFSTLG